MWSGFSTLSFPQARLEFVKETKLRQMGKQLGNTQLIQADLKLRRERRILQ